MHPIIPNKLAFTSLHCSISNYTFDWKTLHKHDSNKYQTKAFVICDHKSDQTRSATHVNKTYLVWLMFQVLSNQHYQCHTNQNCVRLWTQFFKIVRFEGKRFLRSLPPPPSFLFLLSSQLSRLTRAETLATQPKEYQNRAAYIYSQVLWKSAFVLQEE